MKTRIAAPITAPTIAGALKDIGKANKAVDIIELRLDMLKKKPTPKQIQMLINACTMPVICTCRPVVEGGKFGGSDEERELILCAGIMAGADFVDLEFSASRSLRQAVEGLAGLSGTRIILSAHFLNGTPNRGELDNLFNGMAAGNPYAIKIVGTALSEKDNDTIISFLKQHNRKGVKLIAFCMGRRGTRSRVESARHGAFLAFASLGKGKASAEGQMSVKEMRKILKLE